MKHSARFSIYLNDETLAKAKTIAEDYEARGVDVETGKRTEFEFNISRLITLLIDEKFTDISENPPETRG